MALTRALAARAGELGIVLHAAHLHHGLRGKEADGDREFAAGLAGSLGIPFHTFQVDTAGEASAHRESQEEAARRLRYAWFRQLMATTQLDAVATAHTLDDQAETVLGKFIRGAWTEGLSGIHPVVDFPEGRILRTMLAVSRTQVEAYLAGLGQVWREDASNRDDPPTPGTAFAISFCPELEQWNPRIREHLAHMAQLARDEEGWWQSEITTSRSTAAFDRPPCPRRRPRRNSNGSTAGVAIDVVRLGGLPEAVQRRLLRHAAALLGVSLSFDATENLRRLANHGRAGQKSALPVR